MSSKKDKRRLVDSPSTPKSKRTKNADGQSRLDSFFNGPDKLKSSSSTKIIVTEPEIVDVDALDDCANQSSATSSILKDPQNASASTVSRPVKFIRSDQGTAEQNSPQYPPLAVDPIVYDPQPFILHSADTPYSFLAHALSTISGTRSRISILDTLTNTFRTIIVHHPQSLLPSLYLLSNTLSPPYSALELNIGPSTISQAIQQVSGLSPASLKKLYNTSGDPGDVAFTAKSNTRTLIPHLPLLVTSVYQSLLKIGTCKTTKDKQKIIEKLLLSAKGEEIRFLVRTLSQNLRVGAVRTSLLTALARSFVLIQATLGSDKCTKSTEIALDKLLPRFRSAEHLLRKVFVQHPDYGHIVAALLEEGLDGLPDRVPLTVGIPVFPALGTPIRSFHEIYERLNDCPFSAEIKYDGQRAQIHAWRDSDGQVDVRVFSRHLEDMTSKYPDVTGLMQGVFENHQDTESLILDSEIVAIDPGTGSLKSFQALSGRARKNVGLEEVEIPVGVFAFDILYLDGEESLENFLSTTLLIVIQVLLERSFRERRSLLRTRLPPFIPENTRLARFQHVESCDSSEGDMQLQFFWETAVSRHDTEGLMIKLLDDEVHESKGEKVERRKKPLSAVYDADKRTFSWMKLKKDYVSGLGDSLDLIPIGAWYGNGRKVNWWSPILLGIWDSDKGHPVAVCKCMSGFTDAFYKALSERYSLQDAGSCSKTRLWECELGGLKPDVYFKPAEVWEIRGADVTLSPVSVAARHLTSSSKGLSLRFPRFIQVRDDKSITQASDASFLAKIWKNQQGKPMEDEGDELVDFDVKSASEYSEMEDDI